MRQEPTRRGACAALLATAFVAAFAPDVRANTSRGKDAGSFVASLAQEAIDGLTASDLDEGERLRRFRKLFADATHRDARRKQVARRRADWIGRSGGA